MRYFFLLCGALFLTNCADRIYQVAEIEDITSKHTTIAILQPKVDYLFAKPEKKYWSRVPAKETIAEGFQLGLMNLVKDRQERGKLAITVLDVETTNKLLAETSKTNYAVLARKLGVDAVMVSRLEYDARHDYSTDFFRHDNDAILRSRVYLNLFSSAEGLIWSYENVGHRSFETYDRLVRELVRPAARDIPYALGK